MSDATVLLDVHATDMRSILHQTLQQLVANDLLGPDHVESVEAGLMERERTVSTAIGHAVAVPHLYHEVLEQPVVAFVRLAGPLNLGAPDGIPTQFLFLLLGPTGHAAEHLDTLTNIARLMSDDEFRYEARIARDTAGLQAACDRYVARVAPEEPREPDRISQGLRYTGMLCGGLRGDLRRRLPHYISDFTDGWHPRTLSSTLFLFFACLAPAVTFGGIMAELTGNHIGVVEMIVASALCGVIYALISGQPLVILGGTGPLLVFTMILYQLCVGLDVPFLETRAWVGLWTAVLLLVLAATDASCLMRFFTRFTDEIFAALITLIFIFSALHKILAEFQGLEQTKHHDTALLSLLLAMGTLYIATSLSRFRRSRYLLPWMREFLADFGPMLAILAMAVFAFWLSDVELKTLLPDESTSVVPTLIREDTGAPRAWLVDLMAAPAWVRFASIGPAILVAVLVYVDQNITARLVNSPDNKLHKGEAYHLDLAVMGLLIGMCSIFGFPWLVAATVRSLNHVRSLATVEEVVTRDGDRRERIIHTRETRLAALAIHLLIALSLLLLPLLKEIPMAVLYGLFLYMGIVSMQGSQFFERMSLWIMDSKLYPRTHYIRKAPASVVHRFTLLQVACLIVLGIVEVSPLAILFPLFLVLLVPVRLMAGRYFEPEHLEVLDAEEEPEDEETHWAA